MSDHKATKASRLDQVLDLATGHARTELGENENKKVTATATLNVTSDDADATESCGVEAGVTLGVSHNREAKSKK